jgi:KTSC domain
VRYRGMPSKVVADIEYDQKSQRLKVSFVTGRTFEYIDVPADVAASFQSAFSKGTFFNGYIRDRYDFREIMPARAAS